MMANNNIQDIMNSEEINGNENKKIWVAPELEMLSCRSTRGGWVGGWNEIEYEGVGEDPS